MTNAVHVNMENEHVVMFNDLRVLISGDNDKGWFARGIEIDYFACGESLEDVQRNFAIGFEATIKEHLKRYGNIERFLRWAPLEEIMDLLDSKKYVFANISKVYIEKDEDFFIPFDNLCFLKQELRQAA